MGRMNVSVYCGGPVETNGYLVRQGASAWLVDAPEGVADWALEQRADGRPLKWMGLLITHGHWDHITEAARVQKRLGVPVFIHRDSAFLMEKPSIQSAFNPFREIPPCRAERMLDREEGITEDGVRIRFLHCPGHCPGSICYYFPEEKLVFAGDVLFAGGVGRWDLPGGSREVLLKAIADQLLTLPDETRVLPGHGPATTIGHERRMNGYLSPDYLEERA
jgi:glyoxylase-like metal-dependent hydrolase (beta-lactamase superfamily II)